MALENALLVAVDSIKRILRYKIKGEENAVGIPDKVPSLRLILIAAPSVIYLKNA